MGTIVLAVMASRFPSRSTLVHNPPKGITGRNDRVLANRGWSYQTFRTVRESCPVLRDGLELLV